MKVKTHKEFADALRAMQKPMTEFTASDYDTLAALADELDPPPPPPLTDAEKWQLATKTFDKISDNDCFAVTFKAIMEDRRRD